MNRRRTRAWPAPRTTRTFGAARERLVRYVLRPPLAKERLTLLPDNRVRLDLKRPFSDGTYALQMDVLSLLARLAASLPPPRLHCVRSLPALPAA